jgi:tetratricopeptide (TPR) repeat protein
MRNFKSRSANLLRQLFLGALVVGVPVGCAGSEDASPAADPVAEPSVTEVPTTRPEDAEALSLFGAPLRTPALPAEVSAAYEANLAQARADFEAHPDSALAWIWVGRREGYLGHYQRAIAQFSRGFDMHPEDSRFLRHRGHRYITVRQFVDAISDLGRAATIESRREDRVEPDGLPNARGIPTSTLQGNIYYHLALAHYLTGDFEAAIDVARDAMAIRTNPDSDVSIRHWLYTSLRREGRDEEAAAVLEPITADMDIVENQSYHELLLMYKGELTPEQLLGSDDGTSAGSARVYGVGAWYLYNGDEDRAVEIFRQMLESEQWAAFGYIAAEADLKRLGQRP